MTDETQELGFSSSEGPEGTTLFLEDESMQQSLKKLKKDQTSTGNVTGADLAGTDEPEEGLEDDIMFGDLDFCVRPKEEKCILFKVLSFMRHTV